MFIHKAIFISDFHLGTRQCKSERLLHFLQEHRASDYYLVGDVLDTWNLDRGWYFDETQQAVVNEILKLGRISNVHLLSGNHDEANVTKLLEVFSPLPVLESCIHKTVAGTNLLVAHGHQFDTSLFRASSDFHFSLAMMINEWYHENSGFIRTALARLAIALTNPRQRKFYDNIERACGGRYAGIVCGHVHRPKIVQLGKLVYYNCGDWVENCSALVEDYSGQIRLIK